MIFYHARCAGCPWKTRSLFLCQLDNRIDAHLDEYLDHTVTSSQGRRS